MLNQLAMTYLRLTNHKKFCKVELIWLSFSWHVQIKAIYYYIDMSYIYIFQSYNLFWSSVALVYNKPETLKKYNKYPEIWAFNILTKNWLMNFMESLAEVYYITWSKIFHDQELICLTYILQQYLYKFGFCR